MADRGLGTGQDEPIAGDEVGAGSLKVVWLTPAYPWAGQPAGGYFHRTQAAALAPRGVGITIAASVPYALWPLTRLRPQWRAYRDAPSDVMDAGVRVIRPRYPNVPGQPRWALADRFVASAVWRARDAWTGASLVHGHSAIEGLAAWRLAVRVGLPFVLTFHGSDINTWPDRRPDRKDDLVAAIRDAALVIAVSEALAAGVRELAGVEALALPLGTTTAISPPGALTAPLHAGPSGSPRIASSRCSSPISSRQRARACSPMLSGGRGAIPRRARRRRAGGRVCGRSAGRGGQAALHGRAAA